MGLRISDMELSERPRERLLRLGAPALSDAELVSVLLRTGRAGHGVVAEAHALLKHAGGLAELARLEVEDLTRRPGVGPAKAVTLVAALELGRRLAGAEMRSAERLDEPRLVGDFLVRRYRDLEWEVVGILCLDTRHRLIRESVLSQGTRSQALVECSALFRQALLDSAAELVVFHNHPAGDPNPSADDAALTRRLVAAGAVLGVPVVDHVVVAGPRWQSLRVTRPELFVAPSVDLAGRR